MAYLYKTGDPETTVEVTPKDGKAFTLEELQAFVGGPIQMICLPSGARMFAHEEGALIPLPTNDAATVVWFQEFPRDQYAGLTEALYGDILITTPEEAGETEDHE